MKSRHFVIGLCVVGVLGLVWWTFSRTKPEPVASVPAKPAIAEQKESALHATPDEAIASAVADSSSPLPVTDPAAPVVVSSSAAPSAAPTSSSLPQIEPNGSSLGTNTGPVATANSAPPERPEEIAATARMYAAHAPLRTPEVADPDSDANRQVLQTMVLKALAAQKTSDLPISAPQTSAAQ